MNRPLWTIQPFHYDVIPDPKDISDTWDDDWNAGSVDQLFLDLRNLKLVKEDHDGLKELKPFSLEYHGMNWRSDVAHSIAIWVGSYTCKERPMAISLDM